MATKLGTGKRFAMAAFAALLALTGSLSVSAGYAAVQRDDHADLPVAAPLYCWSDSSQKPKAIAIAVHGLIMHGGTFDTMSKQLAANGVIVYAPDLRGYGRWLDENTVNGDSKERSQTDYESSYLDLVTLIREAKKKNPGLPLYCIGESLGTAMILRAAADMPNAIDGMVLSSPAVQPQAFYRAKAKLSGSILTPRRQLDLNPFIKKFISEDPQIAEGAIEDPLVRKSLSALELFKAFSFVKPVLEYAKKVSPDIPILVIQGSDDRMVRSEAVIKLLSELKSGDQTVRWFKNRGHLLLETAYARQDTLETVDSWLDQRLRKGQLAHQDKPTSSPETRVVESFSADAPIATDDLASASNVPATALHQYLNQ